MMHCGYFDTTWKGNYSSFLTPTVVGVWSPLPCEIFCESDAPLFEKRRLRNKNVTRGAVTWHMTTAHLCTMNFSDVGTAQPHGLSAIAEILMWFVEHISVKLQFCGPALASSFIFSNFCPSLCMFVHRFSPMVTVNIFPSALCGCQYYVSPL